MAKIVSHSKTVQETLKMCYKIIRMYDWLLDLYVVDFFVDDHWQLLPASWRDCLELIDPQVIGNLLSGVPCKSHVLPLSLLALLRSIEVLTIPRKQRTIRNEVQNLFTINNHPKMKNLFLRHVKLKKRHEISLMAGVVIKTAIDTDCNAVIDFGSGLGHLVRVLAYKHNLQTAGIDCQDALTVEARKLDEEIEYTLKKCLSEDELAKLHRPQHFNMTLANHEQLSQLALPKSMQHYGLIGLHPCGDLGPLLLKHFVKHDNVTFICVVGCCYMKLTENGYPLSGYVRNLENELSYPAREISCHAIEVYCDRLRVGNYKDLKVHAYRAALERIFQEHDPKLHHTPVRSIKHTKGMTFQKYCDLALERIDLPISVTGDILSRGLSDVCQWRRVVMLYTLRLALAPIVETAVLLDRVLYVLEHDLWCEIQPVFDPKISARNHIIIAKR